MATSATTTSSGSYFQIPGLGNIDTTNIQATLLAAASLPITNLQSQQAQVTQQQTAWRSVNSAVLALGNAASGLTDATLQTTRKANVDLDNILTATAAPGNGLGNYQVSVESVATQHQEISQGYATTDTSLGTGTFTIQVGPASFNPITIDATNNTLSGIADTINKANNGVTASILDAGSAAGSNRYRLMITSNTTGTAGQMTLTSSLSGGTAPTLTDLVAPSDAHIKLGTGSSAIDVYSSDNTVSNAIPGVTLQLKTASPGEAVNVTVSQDTSAATSAVQSLISQFNSLNSQFTSNFTYDTATKTAGTLFGDTTLISLQQKVNSLVLGNRDVGGAYSSLSDIGISTDSTGNLAITNQRVFQNAMSSKPNDVLKLFQDAKSGIATQLNGLVTDYTDPSKGVLTGLDQSFTQSYNDFQSEIDNDQKMVTDEQDRLTQMFSDLAGQLATLNSTNDYITAQIAAFSDTSSSSSKKS